MNKPSARVCRRCYDAYKKGTGKMPFGADTANQSNTSTENAKNLGKY